TFLFLFVSCLFLAFLFYYSLVLRKQGCLSHNLWTISPAHCSRLSFSCSSFFARSCVCCSATVIASVDLPCVRSAACCLRIFCLQDEAARFGVLASLKIAALT